MPYNLISRQNVKGKTIVVRLDLNSPIEAGKLVVSMRLREHAKTVGLLSEKGARLVLLAHQGRKGGQDFVSLEQHAQALSGLAHKNISFCAWDEDFAEAIKMLGQGQVLLLDNTRFQNDEAVEKSPEEHAKSFWVKKIASNADFFVQDALSVCHRSHASVVGFAPLLPCFAGPQLEKEISALQRFDFEKKGRLFILGGAKIADSIELMGFLLENKKAEEIVLGGLLGELFLKANGISLGAKDAFFREKGFEKLLPPAKALLKKFSKKIFLPVDVAVQAGGSREEVLVENLPCAHRTMDIGLETIALMEKKIFSSQFFVFNGPLGVFEEEFFEFGTKKIFGALAESKKAGILGGGDTEVALQELGFSTGDFYFVSLAGKALLEYLSGKKLPGLEILK